MSLKGGWRESKHKDTEKSRGSGRRRFGARFSFGAQSVRVHFSRPEELYVHEDTGNEFPFYTGSRYWVPKGGKEGKGCYIEEHDKCIVNAYKSPEKYQLNIKPIGWMMKLNPKVYYGVTGHVEERFHNVKKKSEKSGSEFFEREICTGRECKLCKEGWEKVFGKKVYFIIARTHWNESIWTTNEQVESSCRCGGFVYTSHFECKKCGAQLVDMMNNCFDCDSPNIELDVDSAKAVCADCQAEWSVYESENEEISKVVNDEMKCTNCGNEELPKPILMCTDCDTPDPYDIFDCQLKIKMVGSKDGKSKDLVIDDVKIQKADERLFDPRFQGEDPEWNQKIAEGMKKPFDLRKQLAPLTPDEEAERLRVPNPFIDGASESRGFKSYSRHESEDGEQQEEQQEEKETTRRSPKGPPVNKGKSRPSGRPRIGNR